MHLLCLSKILSATLVVENGVNWSSFSTQTENKKIIPPKKNYFFEKTNFAYPKMDAD